MTGTHALELDVGTDAVDRHGHVNNVEYVRWMNDAAAAHADARGWTAATEAARAVWVAARTASSTGARRSPASASGC